MSDTTAGRNPQETSQPKLHEVLRQLSTEAAGRTLLSLKDIGAALYARAPRDFITQSEISRLTKIAEQAHRFLGDFLSSGKEYSIEVIPLVDRGAGRNRATGILSAFTDRSFIVDTVGCCLDALGIRKHLFLHPILRIPGRQPISLAYIETDHVAPAVVSELSVLLEKAYNDLFLATSDYSKMLDELEKLTQSFRSNGVKKNGEATMPEEVPEFLSWLSEGSFIFLGLERAEIGRSNGPLVPDRLSQLGVLSPKSKSDEFRSLGAMLDEDVTAMLSRGETFSAYKLPAKSLIHRRVFLDAISVRVPGTQQVISIVGMFSSRANKQETASVPLLRQILHDILSAENLVPDSHAYKELVSVVDNIPRLELLSAPRELLRSDISMITEVSGRPDVRMRVSEDQRKRFASVLVILPKQRMNVAAQEMIVAELETAAGCVPGTSETSLGSSDLPLTLLHVLLPNPSKSIGDVASLEAKISSETITWEENFRGRIIEGNDLTQLPERARVAAYYNKAFPEDYKAVVTPEEAAKDIQFIERLSDENFLEVDIRLESAAQPLLKIFRIGENPTMSAVFPFLENSGLKVQREHVTQLQGRNGLAVGVYRLQLSPLGSAGEAVLSKGFRTGFAAILRGTAENDSLNKLLINPGLDTEQIAVFRLVVRYMHQIGAATASDVMPPALIEYSSLATILAESFAIKFDPDRFPEGIEARNLALEAQKSKFYQALRSVRQLTFDKAFRLYWFIFEATVRTNFYSRQDRSRLAIKLKPESIPGLPLPRPFAEIFVNATDFEGVHLRGGPVARGGIRWSERHEDYRTEVLGLMKTQILKNSIIIPTGAKGGFLLRNKPQDPQELNKAVKHCYGRYIRSLLEITDNREDGKLIHPPRCVVYDGEDPYFVVAADRGTASLSDTANAIATKDFKLWIGDAFASGGSNGYDHKKLAITSRGTWEATCRHFREMGLDSENTDFTVTGIGDMSGDVFGNGLLRSRHAKLIAAFNHKHIFLDPNPNAETSFDERQRLFDLPGSQWSDYNAQLISKGGGIFERASKEISISEEAQRALGITSTSLSGQELIKAILTAPVDLLWNGGIGTYVKSSTEDHLSVGDRLNDDVRVDARELRARVVAEGGNLGFTQTARIEYAKNGGRINTDAIDNSGGVNMSDLEVNIKILLSAPVAEGKLSLEDRNLLLASLVEDVGKKVVRRNYVQSRTISLAVKRSERYLGYYRELLDSLEKEGLLNRKSEFIPPDTELVSRIQQRGSLYRPELAIIIGYSKISLTAAIFESNIPDDPFCEKYLLNYFPAALVEKYREYILKHPLRREIISTEIANVVVDRMGPVFVLRTANETGSSQERVLRTFIAADSIFRGAELGEALDVLDKPERTRVYLQLLVRATAAIDSVTVWLLNQKDSDQSLSETVERYRDKFQTLIAQVGEILSADDLPAYREAWQQLVFQGVSRKLAEELPTLGFAGALMEIVDLSLHCDESVTDLAKLYFQLASTLRASELLERAKEIRSGDPWESSSARILAKEVLHCIGRVTMATLSQSKGTNPSRITQFIEHRPEAFERYQTTLSEFLSKPPTLSGMLVLTNQLYALSR